MGNKPIKVTITDSRVNISMSKEDFELLDLACFEFFEQYEESRAYQDVVAMLMRLKKASGQANRKKRSKS